MKLMNRVGEKYGHLTVIKRGEDRIYPSGKKSVVWICKCDCGNTVEVDVTNLRNNHSKSCGCVTNLKGNVKHNLYHGNRRLYAVWTNMKQRCYNTNQRNYKDYGGRGIYVCEEWVNDFQAFYKWAISNGYKSDLTLDRINNDGIYEPSNCRWTTMLIQRHNQRRLNDWIEIYREWEAGNALSKEADK